MKMIIKCINCLDKNDQKLCAWMDVKSRFKDYSTKKILNRKQGERSSENTKDGEEVCADFE